MLVSLGWFPSTHKARKRLRRLVIRKRIRLVGTVCRHAGRPEHVFCHYRPKADALLHEVQLTEVFLRLDAATIRRGPQVQDRTLLPDAEVWIDGRLYLLELDCGSQGYAQVERRFRKYEGCPHLSLWICTSEARREGLRQRAERLRHTALFTTLAEFLATPHGPIWSDFHGGRAALPRQGDRKGGI